MKQKPSYLSKEILYPKHNVTMMIMIITKELPSSLNNILLLSTHYGKYSLVLQLTHEYFLIIIYCSHFHRSVSNKDILIWCFSLNHHHHHHHHRPVDLYYEWDTRWKYCVNCLEIEREDWESSSSLFHNCSFIQPLKLSLAW